MTSTQPCATSPANTSLKRHIAFFDINSDGKISPLETFTGMRQLNAGLAFSAFTAAGIHLTLSYVGLSFPFFSMAREQKLAD
jgi:hypothetical protein